MTAEHRLPFPDKLIVSFGCVDRPGAWEAKKTHGSLFYNNEHNDGKREWVIVFLFTCRMINHKRKVMCVYGIVSGFLILLYPLLRTHV